MIDVGALLDHGRWSGYLKWLIFLTALTIIFDGADNQLLGIASPSMMKDWSLPRGAFAPLLAVGMAGMIVGGAAGGLLGDRLGRKAAMIGSVALFGMATLGISGINSVAALGVLRFFAGIGLGGAMPNAAALAAEYVPRRQRPVAVTLTIVCVPLGGMLAAYLAGIVLPTRGWRTLFFIGGAAPLVAALLLTQLLVESPRFLARHPHRWPQLSRFMRRAGHEIPANPNFRDGDGATVRRATLGALFTPEFRRDTLGLWGAFFFCLLAVYANFSWIPSLLSGAGLAVATAAKGLLYFNLGGVIGAILGAFVISRVGSKPTMLTLASGAVASGLVLASMTINVSVPDWPILTMLAVSGALINSVQTTMYALAAHVYPASIRATGVGAAASIGRVGGLISTYVGAWSLEIGGSQSYFMVIAAAMAATFIGLAIMNRHVRRDAHG